MFSVVRSADSAYRRSARVDLRMADMSRPRLVAARLVWTVGEVSHEVDSSYRLRDSGGRTCDCRPTRRGSESKHKPAIHKHAIHEDAIHEHAIPAR
jgi:hypothetical protein